MFLLPRPGARYIIQNAIFNTLKMKVWRDNQRLDGTVVVNKRNLVVKKNQKQALEAFEKDILKQKLELSLKFQKAHLISSWAKFRKSMESHLNYGKVFIRFKTLFDRFI